MEIVSRLRRLRHRGELSAQANRVIDVARACVCLQSCQLGWGVSIGRNVRVENRSGNIDIGRRTFFVGGMVGTEIICHRGANIEIGEWSGFNYGVTIEARQQVKMGARCVVGSLVILSDTTREGTAPITIEDRVWLAHGCIVMPGVTVGAGSTVSAGAVVTRDIPENSLAIGNPARAMALDWIAGKSV